jgi:hypothetical protein
MIDNGNAAINDREEKNNQRHRPVIAYAYDRRHDPERYFI